MKVFYDPSDLQHAKKMHDGRFTWLNDLGACPLSTAHPDEAGFLFGYQHGDECYRNLVGDRPHIFDRPEHREELLKLDVVLDRLHRRDLCIPTPRTWAIGIDDGPPVDLTFPLFVRTPRSSWKRGGGQSRVNNLKQLSDEMELLRRAFGWDTPILAREWIDVAVAGKWTFGDVPQEVRVWIVDEQPCAWSFHYLHAVQSPSGFPPSPKDLELLAGLAGKVGSAFEAKLIVADFIRDRRGAWRFIEAGPGAVAGTAHAAVFKFVASKIAGDTSMLTSDLVGGTL